MIYLFTYLAQNGRYLNLLGIFAILGIAFLFSRDRSKVDGQLIINGLSLQLLIGFCVLKTGVGQWIVQKAAAGVTSLLAFADEGSRFMFGSLIDASMPWGFIFAFKLMPVIVFFGALMSVLFYYGIIQKVVAGIGYVIQPLLGTSGVETLCAIANSFLGQTEAPLLVRHYLKNVTRSELMVIMVSGMGTVSGSILVIFAAMGVPAEHLLTASMMAIPATIVIAKILCPETEKSTSMSDTQVSMNGTASNLFDAISSGTIDGLQLALNVGAMLISFIALLALLNGFLGLISYELNYFLRLLSIDYQVGALSLQAIFAFIFLPFGYLLGFTGAEAAKIAELIGTKVAVNEVIAFGQMTHSGLSDRATVLLTYALCGFSNFSCIGIQIGGIGALAPEKRQWLTEFGLYAVLGGALANLLSAMMAGLLL